MRPRTGLDVQEENETLPLQEIKPRFLCRPDHSLVTVLTELLLIVIIIIIIMLITTFKQRMIVRRQVYGDMSDVRWYM